MRNNNQILNWTGIIDNTFSVYRKQLRLYITIALIYSIVNWLKGYFLQYLWQNNDYDWISEIISELLYEWGIGFLVIAATHDYLKKQITTKNAFIQLTQIYPRYLTTQLIYLIPSIIPSITGGILIELPFVSYTAHITAFLLIYLACTYFITTWRLYPPAIVVEGSVESSIKLKPLGRSTELFKNSWWRIFGTLIAIKTLLRAICIICVVSIVLILGTFGLLGRENTQTIAEYAFRYAAGFYWGYTFPAVMFRTRMIMWILYSATGIITIPIFAIGITLIYFNQRQKQENDGIVNISI